MNILQLSRELPSAASVIFHTVVGAFVVDMCFFYSHWMLHSKFFYPRVHKVHHDFKVRQMTEDQLSKELKRRTCTVKWLIASLGSPCACGDIRTSFRGAGGKHFCSDGTGVLSKSSRG